MKNSSEEFPFNGNESNESVLIDRYESMLSQGEVYFYDVDEFEEIKIPDNYVFMTLNQIMGFIEYSMFDMEARSLVSCFNLIKN